MVLDLLIRGQACGRPLLTLPDSAQVCVAESRRILQPISERPVEPDVGSPDQHK
jgi:hypothetical protein